MSNFEKTVEEGLQTLASDVSPGAEERVIGGMRRTRRTRRSAIGAMGAGAAAAVAAIAAVAVFGGQASSNQDAPTAVEGRATTPINSGDTIDLAKVGEPCPGAKHASTIAGIRSATQVPIFAPARAELDDAWTCGDTPVLMFGAIQISYEEGWSDIDVKEKWASLAEETGGHIENVIGRPAYVHPPTTEGPRSSVMLVVDGTLIRLLADGDVPVGQLVALANQIRTD